MAQVSAFRGIRYDPALIQLETVLAPPYDVISPELQQDLYGRAMQNVVRLELGRDFRDDLPGERDRYTRARDHLRVWLAQGVLVRDQHPSIYLHRHSFRPPGGAGPRDRLGCFVGVQPVPHERGEILRHELTLTAPREDRRRLLETTGVLTSPVLLLYENAAEVTTELERLAAAEPPRAEAVIDGEYGPERHQLWPISDRERVERITAGLSRQRMFIADGHHRYETALSLGLANVLALVSPLGQTGNVILATHRVVTEASQGVPELSQALAAAGWRITPVVELSEALDELRGLRETAHAFGIVGPAGKVIASRPRQVVPAADPRAGIDVTVLESEILEPLLGITSSDAAQGRLLYTRDAGEAAAIAAARHGVALLINPTTVCEMADIARAGQAMPQKSTYFFPKVPAGLVIMDVRWADEGAIRPP